MQEIKATPSKRLLFQSQECTTATSVSLTPGNDVSPYPDITGGDLTDDCTTLSACHPLPRCSTSSTLSFCGGEERQQLSSSPTQNIFDFYLASPNPRGSSVLHSPSFVNFHRSPSPSRSYIEDFLAGVRDYELDPKQLSSTVLSCHDEAGAPGVSSPVVEEMWQETSTSSGSHDLDCPEAVVEEIEAAIDSGESSMALLSQCSDGVALHLSREAEGKPSPAGDRQASEGVTPFGDAGEHSAPARASPQLTPHLRSAPNSGSIEDAKSFTSPTRAPKVERVLRFPIASPVLPTPHFSICLRSGSASPPDRRQEEMVTAAAVSVEQAKAKLPLLQSLPQAASMRGPSEGNSASSPKKKAPCEVTESVPIFSLSPFLPSTKEGHGEASDGAFVVLNVEIRPGRLEQLRVRAGESSASAVKRFLLHHQLDPELSFAPLLQFVKDQRNARKHGELLATPLQQLRPRARVSSHGTDDAKATSSNRIFSRWNAAAPWRNTNSSAATNRKKAVVSETLTSKEKIRRAASTPPPTTHTRTSLLRIEAAATWKRKESEMQQERENPRFQPTLAPFSHRICEEKRAEWLLSQTEELPIRAEVLKCGSAVRQPKEMRGECFDSIATTEKEEKKNPPPPSKKRRHLSLNVMKQREKEKEEVAMAEQRINSDEQKDIHALYPDPSDPGTCLTTSQNGSQLLSVSRNAVTDDKLEPVSLHQQNTNLAAYSIPYKFNDEPTSRSIASASQLLPRLDLYQDCEDSDASRSSSDEKAVGKTSFAPLFHDPMQASSIEERLSALKDERQRRLMVQRRIADNIDRATGNLNFKPFIGR